MSHPQYVTVLAQFSVDGGVQPVCVVWEDGRRYEVDRVLDIRPAASLKQGGAGIRYTCRIRGQIRYLFLEENRWFVDCPDGIGRPCGEQSVR